MTVGELKKVLEAYDDSVLVVQSRDAEGNGFMQTDEVSTELWEDEGESRADDLARVGDEAAKECIVLWPA